MSGASVVVYAGKGSSHSWTWAADLLESKGVTDCLFVGKDDLPTALERGASTVIVSGGDGHEIAWALAHKGFGALERHVRSGGTYVGVCAGAYLPLPSKIEPFRRFNLSSTRIMNIVPGTEGPVASSPRTDTPYGSCSVVHPVRGEVELVNGSGALRAPIYGGPVFQEPELDRVVLRYRGFTPRTVLQVARSVADEMMLGRPAVISCRVGDGELVLAGPHMEHPDYPEANRMFLELARLPGGHRSMCPARRKGTSSTGIAKALADLKVAVLGMERESFMVGSKLWDGGRMLELAAAIDKRKGSIDADTAETVAGLTRRAMEELRSLGPERVDYSDSAPALLVEAARLSVNCHFESLRA